MNGTEQRTRPAEHNVFAFFCPHEPGHRFRTKDGLAFEVVRNLTTQEACQADRRLYDAVVRAVPNGAPVHWSVCKLADARLATSQPHQSIQ